MSYAQQNPTFGNNQARPFRDSYERQQYMLAQNGQGSPQPTSYKDSTAYVGRPSQVYQPGAKYTTAQPGPTYTQGSPVYSTAHPTTTYGQHTPYNQAPATVIRQSNTERTTRTVSPGVAYQTRPSAAHVSTYPGSPQYVGQSTLMGGHATTHVAGRSTTGRVSTRELDTKISTIIGEKRLVGRETRSSVVKGYNYGESRLVGENHREGGIVNITENRLEAIVRQSTRPEGRRYVSQEVMIEEEEIVTVERIVEKPVEVIVQRKVPVERIIEVPYDVIVERPVEKIFHREIITEKIMEKPVEKIIEVPVEVVYEIPVEKIIERHIEYETVVEVPVERIVERRVEEYIEQIRYNDRVQEIDIRDLHRYHGHETLPTEYRTIAQEKIIDKPIYLENIIERIVEVPVDRIIQTIVDKVVEIPIERIIERPVYVDNIVHRTIEIPVERIVEVPVERIVERQVYYDNIIERAVPVERVVERTVEVPVERYIDVPVYVDNIVHRTVEIIREVEAPYETVIEHPVETRHENAVGITEFQTNAYERIYERPVKVGGTQSVPVEFIIEKDVYVPREQAYEVQVPQIIGKFVERDVVKTVNVERITERPVPIENIIEVPVRRVIEVAKFVESVVEREVPIEQVIERVIERIIERRVEIPIEKVIEVPVHIRTERAITQERVMEEIIEYDAKVLTAVQGSTQEQVVEIDDQSIEADIRRNQAEFSRLQAENSRMASEVHSFRSQISGYGSKGFGRAEEEVLQLKSRISELESRHSVVDQDRDRLFKKSQTTVSTGGRTQVQVIVEHPDVEHHRRELMGLIAENRRLVETIKRFGNVTHQ